MPRKKISQASLWSSEEKNEVKAPTTRKPKNKQEEKPPSSSVLFTVAKYLDHLNVRIGSHEVVVQGEVSGFKMHPTGAYFDLKDQEEDGLLNCYLSPWRLKKLGFDIEDGLLINATGLGAIRKKRSQLSFTVSEISLVGDGSLRQVYEALKKKLEEEGLFVRKRELSEFIHRIGFVTAKSGEVIHDFRRNLKALGFKVDLLDVRVQGSEAPAQIMNAIEQLNKEGAVEVIILARGGGSLEDLQAFNDERVARAIFKSDIPVLASIGHDRDVPIASLVADLYVSTPTMAAITMNRSWNRLEQSVPLLKLELLHNFETVLERKRDILTTSLDQLVLGMNRLLRIPKEFRERIRLEIVSLQKKIREVKLNTRREMGVIVQSVKVRLRVIRATLESQKAYLEGVSPERNLRLGYSIVRRENGKVVKRAQDLSLGERLTTLFAEGSVTSKVETIKKKNEQ